MASAASSTSTTVVTASNFKVDFSKSIPPVSPGTGVYSPDFSRASNAGRGAFGWVFKVPVLLSPDSQIDLAIKIMSVGGPPETETLREFDCEITILKILHQKKIRHIVPLIDVVENFEYDTALKPLILREKIMAPRISKYTLVMPYCGKSLWDYIGKYEFNVEMIRVFSRPILETLSDLSGKSLAHGDYTSRNILLRWETPIWQSKVTIIDVQSVQTVPAKMAPARAHLFWRAPEFFIQTEQFDASIDMWAFGVTLLQMASGVCPFIARELPEDRMTLLRQITDEIGFPPNGPLLEKWKKVAVDPSTKQFPALSPKRWQLTENACSNLALKGATVEETDAFRELIQRIFIWDSTKRVLPNVALGHSFFTSRAKTSAAAKK